VNVVQCLVRPAKVGHAGTLDPLATGVLVVCIGPATRLIPYLHEARKTYRARFRFGATSPTDDLEGEVAAIPHAPALSLADVQSTLPHFVGTIEQIPPAYSAVHVAGRRAYELARRGEIVSLAAKAIEVFRFEVLDFDESSQELECEIECGSGTYIRSLGRDVALRLGTGAVMTSLQRTAVGPFRVKHAVSPRHLTRDALISALHSPDIGLGNRLRIDLSDEQESAVRCGRFLPIPGGLSANHGEAVVLFGADQRLIAVAHFYADDATVRPKIVFPAD
jgi:tRNA pseudouridine55 synthase